MSSAYTFFTRANVPEKWMLIDALYWRACQLIPEAFYDDNGVEHRNSHDLYSENIFELGEYFGEVYLEPYETKRLGLPDDPRVENYKNIGNDEVYIDSAFSYEIALKYNPHTDKSKMDAFIKENNKKFIRAKAFEEEVQKWKQIFDDHLDRFRAELMVDLKDGKLNCEAITIDSALRFEDGTDELVYDEFSKLALDQSKFEQAFKPVSPSLWISRNLNWKGGYLNSENAVYLGLRFNMVDVLKQYPPILASSDELYVCGNGLVKPDTFSKPPKARTNRGRPTKNWNAVQMRIAEIIATEGALPVKQDALASELVEWYRNSQGEDIGLTTVKARLAPYYQNSNFKKS